MGKREAVLGDAVARGHKAVAGLRTGCLILLHATGVCAELLQHLKYLLTPCAA